MGKQRLTLQSLTGLDSGVPAGAFQAELRKVVEDCIKRPGLDSVRKVQLDVHIKPCVDSRGVCEIANVEFEVSSSIPKQRTREYQMEVHAKGELLFNELSPDDVHQQTLDEVE